VLITPEQSTVLLGKQLMQSLTLLMRIVASKHVSGLLMYIFFFFFFLPSLVSVITHFHGIFDYVFRIEGAIPYLVELLEHADAKVQRAAAGALRTLAFKNDENKNQVEGILAFSIHMVLFCYEFYS
jgi:hypothetical protein